MTNVINMVLMFSIVILAGCAGYSSETYPLSLCHSAQFVSRDCQSVPVCVAGMTRDSAFLAGYGTRHMLNFFVTYRRVWM